ncbi:MAG: lytic transglycosylase domain-containing protein, partial [Thermoanaerobaculia bacterium]
AWEPTTVSSAGAVGLMQIMPKEAAAIATKAGLGSITRDALFEPSINVRVGTAELRQKLDLLDGNQILAIAAYNGGENAVKRWVDRTGLDDIDRFIDSISYGETRLYVMSVTRNLHEYRRIYGDASPE